MGRVEDMEAKLNARMAAMNKRFAGRMGVMGDACPSIQSSDVTKCDRLGIVGGASSSLPGMPDVSGDVWVFNAIQMQGLLGAVISSNHVVSNPQYAALIPKLQFKFIDTSFQHPAELGGDIVDQATVNAYARIDPLEGFPTICLFAGATRYASLMAAAYVGWRYLKMDPEWGTRFGIVPFPQVVLSMVKMFQRNSMRMTSELAAIFANENNLHAMLQSTFAGRKEVETIASGTLMGVLSHEYGHLALGHCNAHTENEEIQRNKEREADSFASSIVSASEFKGVLGLGTIIWELALVVFQDVVGAKESSHPLSRERLHDFIRANPSTAQQIGIDEITALLAPLGIKI